MRKKLIVGSMLFLGFLLWLPASAAAMDLGLVSTLMNKLGVTQQQAEGGAGAIFKTAKTRMSEEDYKKLATSVPEADSLQQHAPASKPESKSGLLGSAASMLGGKSGAALGSSAELLNSFKSLGMDKEMISKFTPIIYDYVKEKGGPMIVSLLQKALAF